jgi:hypothetical protein
VLLVDFDPQGALSVGLGFQPHELDATVYNVLMDAAVTASEVLFRPRSMAWTCCRQHRPVRSRFSLCTRSAGSSCSAGCSRRF